MFCMLLSIRPAEPIPKYNRHAPTGWVILLGEMTRGATAEALGTAMRQISAPISLAGSRLGQPRHVCAFFNSAEEEYRVLLPFIKDGFECGDKAIHVISPDQHRDHLQRLAGIGIDSTAVQRSGQFELRSSTETYLQDGRFDQNRMLQSFEQMANDNSEGRFPLSRIVCRMDWASDGQSHIDDLIEFEARVNDVWCRHHDAVICTYHLSKFSGEAVIDIMRTHPLVIVGGILQHNPFFVPPGEFLHEIRARRAGQPARPATLG